jgi:tRNA-dihydrouridine synthase
LGNPWLFRSIRERLAGRPDPGPPDIAERARVFTQHIDLITAHSPGKKLVHELRKAVAWYTKGLRDSAHVRDRAFNVLDPVQVRDIALSYFSSLMQENNLIVSAVDKATRQVA